MDKKPTDNEIIKALECHIKRQCWNDCPNATEKRQLLNRPCSSMIAEDALDLINRQKEEIERLTTDNKLLKSDVNADTAEINGLKRKLVTAKAEAYKECVKKVKELIKGWNDLKYYSEMIKAENDLDSLLKEMVGAKDNG